MSLGDINAVVRMDSQHQTDDILSVCQDDRRILRNRDITPDTPEPSVGQLVSITIARTGKKSNCHHSNTALLADNDGQQTTEWDDGCSTPPAIFLTPLTSVRNGREGEEDDIPVPVSSSGEKPGCSQQGGGVETDRKMDEGASTRLMSSRQKISDDKKIFVSKT